MKKVLDSPNKYEQFAKNWYSVKGNDSRISSERAMVLKKLGFWPGVDLWYDFDMYDYETYANDRDFFYMHPLNGWLTKLIDDKRFIPILFKEQHQYLPEVSIGVEDCKVKYIIENGTYKSGSTDLQEALAKYVSKHSRLFLKHAGLSGGRGARIIQKNNIRDVLSSIKVNHAYIINELLSNEDYSDKINPNNLNTIRVYFYKHLTLEHTIKTIVQRFGTVASGVVDNLSGGGMACEINPKTGMFSKAFAPEQKIIRHDFHVDTKHKLTGFVVPQWKEKFKQIKKILAHVSFLDYGALDIATTTKGLKVLEINSLPSNRLLQINQPAFLDKKFKEFCISKGYGSFSFDENDEL